ncbi:MarC family protein [Candidatus Chlamydia corallus]|uniref:MarC family protein n=1 Tax=Candidatus Chlamydia corallus TaxID=2038470 RepID=UPI000C2FE2E9|nr:MarC family protein [Candidatus Chlamydia corallus]
MIQFSFLLPQACILLLASDSLTNVLALHYLLTNYSLKQRMLILLRESCFAFIAMFALYGLSLGGLKILNTPVCTIQVVGGIAVTLTGARAVLRLGKEEAWIPYKFSVPQASSPWISPIALPLMFGPSWLAACCTLIGGNHNTWINFQILILSWTLITLSTFSLQIFCKRNKVLLATQTVLGLFVTIVGTQLLVSGLQQAFL